MSKEPSNEFTQSELGTIYTALFDVARDARSDARQERSALTAARMREYADEFDRLATKVQAASRTLQCKVVKD